MSFCPYPFMSFSLQQGHRVRPCCSYRPKNDISDFENNPNYHLERGEFYNIRERMLNGEKLPECSSCYEAEKSIGKSRRTRGIKKWPDVQRVNKWNELRHLEIMIDNLCNFECRMCDSWQSSKLRNRDKFLGKDVKKFSKANIRFLRLMDLSCLETMQLQGGEPFISPNFEEVIDLVEEQIDLKDVHLYITTNGSTIPSDDIVNKLREFKLIDLSVSIDSSHKVNQYIRHGDHESILENVKYFNSWSNVELNVTTNVNVYNADTMPETEEFFRGMGYDWFWAWTTNTPCVLDYAPDEYKEWLFDRVKGTKFETAYREFYKDKKYNSKKWSEFIDETKKLDEWYDTRLSDYHRDLAKFLYILYDDIQ